jgi:predicted metal-dependent phosphoesterase TrpH
MVPQRYDLHSHSTFSDGTLQPAEVVARAAAAGITCLALTDHDEVAGLGEAHARARQEGIEFIAGVEVSVSWRTHTLHVLGLRIDPDDANLKAGLAAIRTGRRERALRIAQALERAGIAGTLDGARAYADNPELVSRTHFARYLVDQGHARDLNSAFQRFLASGSPGHVAHQWAALDEAVGWIRASGGYAVVAHPARYKLDTRQREELLAEFRDLGGSGIEVASGNHSVDQTTIWGRYAARFGLLASVGSDFHGPGAGRDSMDRLPALPAGCAAIWEKFIRPTRATRWAVGSAIRRLRSACAR